MSYRRLFVSTFALSLLLFTASACGGDLSDDEPLSEFDETQSQTLCEELQDAGACTYESEGSETEVAPPEDCDTFSERIANGDEEKCKEVTAGDARDCQKACGDNREACSQFVECVQSGRDG